MAKNETATAAPVKRERKAAPPIQERMKNQLTTAALRQKISKDDLDSLNKHIDKLKALLEV